MDPNTVNVFIAAGSALAGVIGAIVAGKLDRSDRKRDDDARRQAEHEAFLTALRSIVHDRGARQDKNEDRQIDTFGGLEGLKADVRILMSDRGKCDELSAKVAVLEDHKHKDERRADLLDAALRDIASMKRDIKTLFEQGKNLPDAVVAQLRASLGFKASSLGGVNG